jgi:hypothetical protein
MIGAGEIKDGSERAVYLPECDVDRGEVTVQGVLRTIPHPASVVYSQNVPVGPKQESRMRSCSSSQGAALIGWFSYFLRFATMFTWVLTALHSISPARLRLLNRAS